MKTADPVRHTLTQMVYNARQRSKKRQIPCVITIEDLLAIVPKKCPILGISLSYGAAEVSDKGHAADSAASLDRKVPALGYIPGNVSIISKKANLMKSNASKKDLLRIAKWVNSPGFKLYYSKKT